MRLSDEQIQEKLAEVTGWERRENFITRLFQFPDFKAAIAFVNKVAEVAEELDHHPDILISYRNVQLSVFTHSEGGLTEKDFELARRINALV